jgi:hypothetical protein
MAEPFVTLVILMSGVLILGRYIAKVPQVSGAWLYERY